MPQFLQDLIGSPWIIPLVIGLYFLLKKTPADKKRRRILAMPPEPTPPTEGDAFEALGTIDDRMIACNVSHADRQTIRDLILPKIISPKE